MNKLNTEMKELLRKFFNFVKTPKAYAKYFLLIIPVVAVIILVLEIQHRQSLNSSASAHQATVAFQVQNGTLPPENSFGVWITSSNPVSFANINITFDPKLVKLTKEYLFPVIWVELLN